MKALSLACLLAATVASSIAIADSLDDKIMGKVLSDIRAEGGPRAARPVAKSPQQPSAKGPADQGTPPGAVSAIEKRERHPHAATSLLMHQELSGQPMPRSSAKLFAADSHRIIVQHHERRHRRERSQQNPNVNPGGGHHHHP